ncbi:hypothetical protein GCM10012288_22510 [Malaciobacter pacificus]|uniref:Uncharacterized protein n=1 Tax=Malaciobacter pacificus TaxID=1080223 RepID=A0A5C2H4T3_9BACT|nr:hypothetical protein [Malaciobacter pacificus]QEP33188.1 hypothetical protein APAC_0013 [Malaciobacter pacificus]GGD47773.1 hypothetical protein GCM10012288_22510 [Malaciobacter pacificus]
MKSLIKKIAKDYNVNHKALKYYIKDYGFKPKQISRLEILEILYENCTELFYTRMDSESNIVEFLHSNIMNSLISEMNILREVNNG